MKPRVLFLDDDDNRHRKIRPHLIGCQKIVQVKTATEAISALKCYEFDIVFLDHDLGGEIFVSSDRPDTGMFVAKVIALSRLEIPLIVIHSCNPDGAVRMHDVLKSAKYNVELLPFTHLIPHLPRLMESITRLTPHISTR